MSTPTFQLPPDVTCNGRQDFGGGRPVLLCFTDITTKGDFYVLEDSATDEMIAHACKVHRKEFEKTSTEIAAPGFTPSRSQILEAVLKSRVASACFAPVALLLMLCTAQAKPTAPAIPDNLRYSPFVEVKFDGSGREIATEYHRLIDGGKRHEHVIVFRDGTRKRFIYEVPNITK